jgi:fused signal recognition particle receptor
MFGKLKGIFKKTEEEVEISLSTKIKKTVTGKAKLSEDELDNIAWNFQMSLMQNDVGMEVAEAICSRLKEELSGKDFHDPKKEVKEIFHKILIDILTPENNIDFLEFIKAHEKPVKIVFFGINGCGKTTTIAKLTELLQEQGISVVLAAGDTFRAGAIEQLAKHAERLGTKLVKHEKGGDSAAVIFDAVKHATANSKDVVFADTSGRMQSDVDLMGEMKKIIRVNSPDLKIFIGDALTGNDAIDQVRRFDEEIGIDAAILAKYDASNGGAALSVAQITGKPILFLGVGQSYKDLQPFVAEEFVNELLS